MRKADYIEAMAAFYEVGDVQLMQDVFVSGYVRSIIRSSDIPAAMKLSGFQPEGCMQNCCSMCAAACGHRHRLRRS